MTVQEILDKKHVGAISRGPGLLPFLQGSLSRERLGQVRLLD